MAVWVRSMLFLFVISILQPGVVHLLREDCDVIFDGLCYKSHEYARGTYYEAARNCTSDNGRLAVVNSVEVRSILLSKSVRTSDNYHDSFYDRYWINGNSTNTSGGECLIWNPSNGRTFYERCDYWNKFICEYGGYSCPVNSLDITNGFIKECPSGGSFPYKSVVNVQCVYGYILDGPSNITCSTDGTWTSIPRCIPGCSLPDPISSATLISSKPKYYIGETATYICQSNLYSNINPMETHITVTCGNESLWSPSAISCEAKMEMKIQTVDVKMGGSFTLHCDINEVEGGTWQWLKDSKDVNSIILSNMTIRPHSGDLTVYDFNEALIGTYVCMHTLNKTCTGKTAYYVREKVKCDPYNNQTETHTLLEESSAFLLCEYSNPDAEITWIQNGVKIVNSYQKNILPDGTLYLPKVDGSVSGMYTCIVKNKLSSCEYIKKMNVSVITTTTTSCGEKNLGRVQPWTVSLWWYDEVAPFCYGIIIDRSWVLTSAHCLTGFNRKRNPKVYVQLGNGRDIGNGTHRIAIESVIAHRRFNPRLYVNDIGLIKLKETIIFSKGMSPICLTSKEIVPENVCNVNYSMKGVVSGWGSLDKGESEEMPPLRQEPMAVVTSTENSTCQYKYPYSKSTICAERVHKGENMFPGDSGSPLVIPWRGRMYLLGIYSWGERGAYNEAKEYFTNVSEYMYWIKQYIETV